jgi:hypothetical protein
MECEYCHKKDVETCDGLCRECFEGIERQEKEKRGEFLWK